MRQETLVDNAVRVEMARSKGQQYPGVMAGWGRWRLLDVVQVFCAIAWGIGSSWTTGSVERWMRRRSGLPVLLNPLHVIRLFPECVAKGSCF